MSSTSYYFNDVNSPMLILNTHALFVLIFQPRKLRGAKIKQTVDTRGMKIRHALDILDSGHFSDTNVSFMRTFVKASGKTLTQLGQDLKKRMTYQFKWYDSLSASTRRIIATQEGKKSGMESMDSFMQSFNKLYHDSEAFRSELLIDLLKALIAKHNGVSNPHYAPRVINFMLAISASGDRKAFQFVSANLSSMSVRHAARLTSKLRSDPFINIDQDELVNRIKQHIARIRSLRAAAGVSDSRIAFTVGFDGTVLAKSFQVLHTKDGNVVVGGAYPNHFVPLPEDDTGGKILCDYVAGKMGEPAAEIKVGVLSIQNTPARCCPYVTLVGRPQSINEQSTFGEEVISACVRAVNEDGNSVLLNTTTDGVSTEVQWNLKVVIDYLDGKCDYVSLPDTNHNVKNSRYQLFGGSSAAVIGHSVVDPELLRLAKVNQKLWRVDDFASDALLLRLASVDTIQKLVALGSTDKLNCDVGNHAVTIVSLVFLRLRAYSVNATGLPWRDRAIYSWMSMIWFTCFHTSGSTMMANKRNMVLETVGLLFLVARADVHHPRRNTSECNEHTYGMWRTMAREFNVEQLVRIVQKSEIKTNCIYEGNLKSHRSKDGLSGYQATFQDYVDSSKRRGTCGSVRVDTTKKAVDQLWEEVLGIIEFSNARMNSFLLLFGIEEGNGLSPFMCRMKHPSDLKNYIIQFFKRPKKDMRGCGSASADEDDITTDEDDAEGILVNDTEDDDIPTAGALSPNLIAAHVSHINIVATDNKRPDGDTSPDALDLDVDEEVDVEESEEAVDASVVTHRDSDRSGAQSCFTAMTALIDSKELDEVASAAFNLIQFLQLGKLESGSIASESKYMSRPERWFRAKPANATSTNIDDGQLMPDCAVDTCVRKEIYMSRNSLVQCHCKRGMGKNAHTTVEFYRVLGFFDKHYNKWYMAADDKFHFTPNEPAKMKGIRFLAQLMVKRGSSYTTVQLTKNGEWGPTHVFCTKSLSDILPMGGQGPVELDLFSG